jgi:hypothetical protein
MPVLLSLYLGTRGLLCSGIPHYQQVKEHSHIGIISQVCTYKAPDIQCCNLIQLRPYDDN